MIKKFLVLAIIGGLQFAIHAQDSTKAIEDNSYFIEEAYNQENRVVQHIFNGDYQFKPFKNFRFSFTQEWPFFSQKHQLSYTVGYSWLNSNEVNGISDFMINYRYQLTGHDAFITLAPRLTIIVPTGKESEGLGNGVWGYQFNLPMSKRISNSFVCHANVGFALLPGTKTTDFTGTEYKTNYWNINLGASLIWLATKKLNIMFEWLHNTAIYANNNNEKETENWTIISPGLRFAIDVKNLQIVPGIAVPIIIDDKNSYTGMFFYLSFEHPF